MKKAAIGVDIGGTSVKLGVVNEKGKVLFYGSFMTRDARGRTAFLAAMDRCIRSLRSQARRAGYRVTGIGIGAPGAIDVERGYVHFFPNIPGWKNVPLARLLSRRTGLPVRIDNDANAMAYGESVFGAGRGARDVIALTIGTGLGGGLVIGGRLFHGPTFSAAELGHMTLNENGPLCGCGNRGCIETYVGNGYFVREARRRMRTQRTSLFRRLKEGHELSPKLMSEEARKGDRLSQRMWSDMGSHLGTHLAGLVNLLNPQRIVIGGGMGQNSDLYFPSLNAAIKKKAFPIAARSVRVVKARLGVDAGLIGAAALILV